MARLSSCALLVYTSAMPMLMQPNPISDTCGPLLPNCRFSMKVFSSFIDQSARFIGCLVSRLDTCEFPGAKRGDRVDLWECSSKDNAFVVEFEGCRFSNAQFRHADHQWINQRDQWQEYDLEPIDQIGGPERQITLQQRRTGMEEAFGRIANREFKKFGRWEVGRLVRTFRARRRSVGRWLKEARLAPDEISRLRRGSSLAQGALSDHVEGP